MSVSPLAAFAARARKRPLELPEEPLPRAPSLRDALRARPGIVAELKPASPSAGDLRALAAPGVLARRLIEAGAAGISALTVPEGFRGSPALLAAAVRAGGPVLMKDFVVTRRQLDLAHDAGASAVLLILDLLTPEHSEFSSPREALEEVRTRGLETLLEVYDDAGYRTAARLGADMVGVNNRDLRDPSLPVDGRRTMNVLARCGAIPGTPVLALSGAATADHVREQVKAGASGVLIGSALMVSADPAAKLRDLMEGLT